MCERSLWALDRFALVALATLALSGCWKPDKPQAPAARSAPVPERPAPAPVPAAVPTAPTASPGTQNPPAAPVPQPSAAVIGRIEALEGDVRIGRSSGEVRAQTGMAIEEGDTVRSAADAWALMAMSDGASVTLRPNSELRFDLYRYSADGDAKANSALLSLAKGALRSITGYIGKGNRAGYQVKTATATIGIRGTDHEPAYYPPALPGETPEHPPGTYDKVNAGESVIRSPAGTLPVKRGQTAFANFDAKVRPQILARPPAFYQRQAEVDKRVEVRRAQFHRDFEQAREKRLAELKRQQQEQQKQALDERKARQQQERAAGVQGQKARQDERKREQEKQRGAQQEKPRAAEQQQLQQKDSAKPASPANPANPAKGAKEDKKGAAPKDEKKGPPAKDDRKAKGNEKRDEQKAALPPAVSERIRNMQRGDRASSAASPSERRDAKSDAAGGQGRQPPQRQQPQQREQQQQQSPSQQPAQQAQPRRQQGQPQTPDRPQQKHRLEPDERKKAKGGEQSR